LSDVGRAKKESLDYALALMQEVLAGTKGTKTGKDETRETWGDLGRPGETWNTGKGTCWGRVAVSIAYSKCKRRKLEKRE